MTGDQLNQRRRVAEVMRTAAGAEAVPYAAGMARAAGTDPEVTAADPVERPAGGDIADARVEELLNKHMSRWSTLLDRLK